VWRAWDWVFVSDAVAHFLDCSMEWLYSLQQNPKIPNKTLSSKYNAMNEYLNYNSFFLAFFSKLVNIYV
jgi:hypothetical protein